MSNESKVLRLEVNDLNRCDSKWFTDWIPQRSISNIDKRFGIFRNPKSRHTKQIPFQNL